MRRILPYNRAFTLIELSIVLVIIGLIVGGILVGQDLIRAASVRGTITQIEKYNTAANTFRGKYGYLPGDIKDPDASSFGFAARGIYHGQGDGNGIIEGCNNNDSTCNTGFIEGAGETVMFWVDLSTAHLIDDSFSIANPTLPPTNGIPTNLLNSYFPLAKLGGGNYFYVYSISPTGKSGTNYYGLSAVTSIPHASCDFCVASGPGLTVAQAAAIDQKIDDGYPQLGNITATFLNYASGTYNAVWAAGGGQIGVNYLGGPAMSATSSSSTTCYDNSNVTGATQQYSMKTSNGSNINCALSFRFQ